ncbi:MAG: galactokinase [Opitutus sp.]|nr:galactokinase [Opitutus sp.]
MKPVRAAAAEAFREIFGREATALARAPGRVEFIGNHTDYNGGSVLGAAIDRHVTVAAARSEQRRLRLFTKDGPAVLELPSDQATRVTGSDAWANYPLGVWRALADFQLPRPEGFDLYVSANLPSGAGLSSSAALELAVALVLLKIAGRDRIDPATLAQVGRHAENHYVGVPCGILDQGTIAHARAGQLVRIDCQGPVFSLVPFPEQAALWVFNTREKHALVDGLYAERHRECQQAAQLLGVNWLCDLRPAERPVWEAQLPALLARRVRHVVDENDRVRRVSDALGAGNLAETGRILVESHRSSQHNFENSTPALDALVDQLANERGVYGARLTGGGFGGAVVALAAPEFTRQAAQRIGERHAQVHGLQPEILELHAADGAALLELG